MRSLPQTAGTLSELGVGASAHLWHILTNLGALNLAAARALEPHLDALGILSQATQAGTTAELPVEPRTVTWGVFAARTTAVTASSRTGGQWTLTGTKSWCSLATNLDWALVTAEAPDGYRLFAVDLRSPGVTSSEQSWEPLGLREIPSVPLTFRDVTAHPVGEPGWYLERPGFAWGGMSVAACWLGGALGLYRHLSSVVENRELDELALAALGQGARLIHTAGATLALAADDIDAGRLDDPAHAWSRALAVRGCIAENGRRICSLAAELAGPAGLAFDRALAQGRADLELYMSQHKGARDDAAMGRRERDGETLW